MNFPGRSALFPIAVAATASLAFVGCTSDSDVPDDNAPTEVDGTVNPSLSDGAGGGEPTDNLNDGDTQQPAQGGSNSDLDSNNGG